MRRTLAAIFALTLGVGLVAADKPADRDALWAAVRNGDAKAVKTALDAGADVNAKNEIGVTALWIAASKGKLDVVELLLDRGADVNARDGIWYQTPLSLSLGGFIGGGNTDVVKRLLKAGAKDVDAAAMSAAARGNVKLLQLMLDIGKVTKDALDAALHATSESNKEVREALTKAGAKPLPAADPKDREAWAALAGTFENDNASSLTIKVSDAGLAVGSSVFRPTGPDTFAVLGNPDSGLSFERKGDKVTRVVFKRFTAETYYYPAKAVAKPTAPPKEGDVTVAAAISRAGTGRSSRSTRSGPVPSATSR